MRTSVVAALVRVAVVLGTLLLVGAKKSAPEPQDLAEFHPLQTQAEVVDVIVELGFSLENYKMLWQAMKPDDSLKNRKKEAKAARDEAAATLRAAVKESEDGYQCLDDPKLVKLQYDLKDLKQQTVELELENNQLKMATQKQGGAS